MTISNLVNEFGNISLDPLNRAHSTPAKTLVQIEVNPVSPDSDSSVSSDEAPPTTFMRSNTANITDAAEMMVSEHKMAEMEGRHLEEPLLKDNPGRFVLFPIQDADVSYIILYELIATTVVYCM